MSLRDWGRRRSRISSDIGKIPAFQSTRSLHTNARHLTLLEPLYYSRFLNIIPSAVHWKFNERKSPKSRKRAFASDPIRRTRVPSNLKTPSQPLNLNVEFNRHTIHAVIEIIKK